MFSVGSKSVIHERVRYSAYGVARHVPAGDLDGDGLCGYADLNRMLGVYGQDVTYGNPGYDVDDDLDQDGEILYADFNIVLGNYGVSLPEGRVSMQTVGNTVGYCGYLYDPAIDRYSVRFRWYDANTGRWLSRDPSGFADGLNLYNYVRSDPISNVDPFGLESKNCRDLAKAAELTGC